jgi:cephalosporin hydroxylase
MDHFDDEVRSRVAANGSDPALRAAADAFMNESIRAKYSYNFSWLGRPVIQYPQDIVGIQELVWSVQPDLVIETGIARGGSLVFLASMMELLAACGGPADGRVVGVDIDIRAENRVAIERHPLARRITMLQGSSVDESIVAQVRAIAKDHRRVMVILDSNHTHEHVLRELHAYAGLVSVGSYCLVMDTVVEDLAEHTYPDRPWGKGDNPRTAVRAFLEKQAGFEVDASLQNKLMVTVAPGGFLRRVG